MSTTSDGGQLSPCVELFIELNTVDYAVVYEGEIWLDLDDAKTVHLKKGDVVVQNVTRHAWRNKGTAPVTMLFFLNGAKE
jgi:quercetin dioxygenase-like cupin family protein